MKVEFNLNLDDLETYNLYYLKHVPRYIDRDRNRLIAYLLAGIFIVVGIFSLVFSDIPTGIIVIVGGILLLFYYVYRFSTARLRRIVRQELNRAYGKGPNDVIGKHILTISPDGITDITDMGESITHWRMIEKVIDQEQFIFLTMIGGMKAHIIPKKAFMDDASLNQFLAESGTFQKTER
ncbi:MAG: YcxB family protein [Dehalococcoidales bacterium]|nr:YcxB family protein [Dehalococcoidales bacterium]